MSGLKPGPISEAKTKYRQRRNTGKDEIQAKTQYRQRRNTGKDEIQGSFTAFRMTTGEGWGGGTGKNPCPSDSPAWLAKLGWLFLVAEAVDDAHFEAEVVLEGSAVGGAEVAGRDAEGEVGVEVEVDVGADGECGTGAGGRPEAEVGGGDALRGAVDLADGSAAEGEGADGGLLAQTEAVGGAG